MIGLIIIKMKVSELFEGDKSSLKKTYDEAVAKEQKQKHKHILDYSICYDSFPVQYACKVCGGLFSE